MKQSSTANRQLEFSFSAPARSPSEAVASAVQPALGSGAPSDRIGTRTSGGSKQLVADTTRNAGRLNAASATEGELQELLAERAALLKKQFEKTISRREELRLQYVRWSLDRIEDAKYGADFEALDAAISAYEEFGDDIRRLTQDLSGRKGKR